MCFFTINRCYFYLKTVVKVKKLAYQMKHSFWSLLNFCQNFRQLEFRQISVYNIDYWAFGILSIYPKVPSFFNKMCLLSSWMEKISSEKFLKPFSPPIFEKWFEQKCRCQKINSSLISSAWTAIVYGIDQAFLSSLGKRVVHK